MQRVAAAWLVTVLIFGAILTGAMAGRDVPGDTVYKPQGLLGWLLPFHWLFFPWFLFGPFGRFGYYHGFDGGLNKGNNLNAKAEAAPAPAPEPAPAPAPAPAP